jgi:drug/metabolite transporter (DMT)-like permease
MTATQILMLIALTCWSVYKQTIRTEVNGKGRFKMAKIYGIVGLVVGGFYLPTDAIAWATVVLSIGASALVGVMRGNLTRLSVEDGKVFSQGNALTIGLFLGLVAFKFLLGTWLYFNHPQPHNGFGEILVLIAIMVAVQAQIVWLRAQKVAAISMPSVQ